MTNHVHLIAVPDKESSLAQTLRCADAYAAVSDLTTEIFTR